MEVRTRRTPAIPQRRGSHRRDARSVMTSLGAPENSRFHPAAEQQTLASALLDCCLVSWLKDSALGLWLCERATDMMDSRVVIWLMSTPHAKLLLLLCWAVLCLLLLWLLSDLHLGLPCFLLGLFYWMYNGPVMRAVSRAWAQWGTGQ